MSIESLVLTGPTFQQIPAGGVLFGAAIGTTPRTQASRNSDRVYAADFGAVAGTSTTGIDCAPAITAAAAAVGNGSVILSGPAFWWLRTTPVLGSAILILENGANLFGAGAAGVARTDPFSDTSLYTSYRRQAGPDNPQWTDYTKYVGLLQQTKIAKTFSAPYDSTAAFENTDHVTPSWIVYYDDRSLVNPSRDRYDITAQGRRVTNYRGMFSPTAGVNITDRIDVQVYDLQPATPGTTNSSIQVGETTGSYMAMFAMPGRANANHGWWGKDWALMTSSSGPSQYATGASLVLFNPFPAPTINHALDLRGMTGVSIVSLPGQGINAAPGTLAGLTGYTWDCGLCVGGFNGPFDGASAVFNGTEANATPAFNIGISVGGSFSPWSYARNSNFTAQWFSQINTAIEIQRHVVSGITIRNKHPLGPNARAIFVEPDGGTSEFGTSLTLSAGTGLTPFLFMQCPGIAADTGVWAQTVATNGDFQISAVTDAFGAPSVGYQMSRTAAVVSGHQFFVNGLQAFAVGGGSGGSFFLPQAATLNYASDAAAGAGGVAINQVYLQSGALHVRLS